jgi:proteasome lid subunit RPN8/RPN11
VIEQYEQTVLNFLGPQAIEDAKKHALAQFPKESCGFIAGGAYVACENLNAKPLEEFTITDPRYDAAVINKTLQAVIHSHPHGTLIPSQTDMAQQIATNVPWGVITLNEKGIHKMIAWGGNLPIAPLIGRPFIHGVFDCYSCVRDVFRLGKDELAKENITWPLPPIALPEVARGDMWWEQGDDLYMDHLLKVGFKQIGMGEAKPGDGFLVALGDSRVNPKKRINHAGVLLGHDQILHHIPTRLCSRMPAGPWANSAQMWVRYGGPTS